MAYKEPTEGALADRLSPKQIAKRLGSCEATVYAMLRRGDIPSIKIGRRWRVDPAVFEAWLAGRPMNVAPVDAVPPMQAASEPPAAATGNEPRAT